MDYPIQSKQEILRQRAEILAIEPKLEEAPEGRLEYVEFLLAGEHYGLPLRFVREIVPLKDFSSVPCTPAFILGLINLRGQILTVIDLRKFFDLPGKGISDRLNKVIVLKSDEMEVGILADSVVQVGSILLSELQPSLATFTGIRAEYLCGITSERMVVLDAGRILSDPALLVDEEV